MKKRSLAESSHSTGTMNNSSDSLLCLGRSHVVQDLFLSGFCQGGDLRPAAGTVVDPSIRWVLLCPIVGDFRT